MSTSDGHFMSSSAGSQDTGTGGTGTGTGEDVAESVSSQSGSGSGGAGNDYHPNNKARHSPTQDHSSMTLSISPSIQTSDGLRRAALRARPRSSRAQVIVIVGPPGWVYLDRGLLKQLILYH